MVHRDFPRNPRVSRVLHLDVNALMQRSLIELLRVAVICQPTRQAVLMRS
jgi:hypothetical protein